MVGIDLPAFRDRAPRKSDVRRPFPQGSYKFGPLVRRLKAITSSYKVSVDRTSHRARPMPSDRFAQAPGRTIYLIAGPVPAPWRKGQTVYAAARLRLVVAAVSPSFLRYRAVQDG
ncbi:hypothetical protein K663_20633 (plasmid) [Sphingobium sp. MI1205]|nr:hypothetical protein K663_20633 [Sphingobium sp. MI1205]